MDRRRGTATTLRLRARAWLPRELESERLDLAGRVRSIVLGGTPVQGVLLDLASGFIVELWPLPQRFPLRSICALFIGRIAITWTGRLSSGTWANSIILRFREF